MTLFHYPESDPSFIGYGPSQDGTIPSCVATSQEIEADIDAFVKRGLFTNQETLPPRSRNTSLLASGNKLKLLQLASSTVMERGQSVSEEDEPAAQETQPPQVLTEDCLLVPSDLEDSETQIPTAFLVSHLNRTTKEVNPKASSSDSTDDESADRHPGKGQSTTSVGRATSPTPTMKNKDAARRQTVSHLNRTTKDVNPKLVEECLSTSKWNVVFRETKNCPV